MKIIFNIAATVFYLALIALVLNFAGNILYALYLWGGVGLPLAVAAWTAAKLWLLVFLTGLITLIVSFTVMKLSE